jgi:hypothetical protein
MNSGQEISLPASFFHEYQAGKKELRVEKGLLGVGSLF